MPRPPRPRTPPAAQCGSPCAGQKCPRLGAHGLGAAGHTGTATSPGWGSSSFAERLGGSAGTVLSPGPRRQPRATPGCSSSLLGHPQSAASPADAPLPRCPCLPGGETRQKAGLVAFSGSQGAPAGLCASRAAGKNLWGDSLCLRPHCYPACWKLSVRYFRPFRNTRPSYRIGCWHRGTRDSPSLSLRHGQRLSLLQTTRGSWERGTSRLP